MATHGSSRDRRKWVPIVVLALLLAGCRGTTSRSEPSASVPTRAPDATVTVDDVRLELWTSQRSVALGVPLMAAGRATNLGGKPVWYAGRPCAQPLNGLVTFPAFDAYGRRLVGPAGAVKSAWARGYGSPLDRFSAPDANSYFGGGADDSRCHLEEEAPLPMSRLDPGRSVALTVPGVPEWEQGALPQGKATLGVIFSFVMSERYDGESARVAYASVAAAVRGGTPTIAPGAALDAALLAPGVPSYLREHEHATQLTADPRLSARQWTVGIRAIDVRSGTKTVAPTLEVAVDRASGRVLSVTTRR